MCRFRRMPASVAQRSGGTPAVGQIIYLSACPACSSLRPIINRCSLSVRRLTANINSHAWRTGCERTNAVRLRPLTRILRSNLSWHKSLALNCWVIETRDNLMFATSLAKSTKSKSGERRRNSYKFVHQHPGSAGCPPSCSKPKICRPPDAR